MVRWTPAIAMFAGSVVFAAILTITVHTTHGGVAKDLQMVHVDDGNEPKDLEMLHIIMRHGARTPVDTYPNDPYVNYTFDPVGWGYLTNVRRKKELYDTGVYFRKRYDDFLGSLYKPDEYYVQSTDSDRTKSTVQVVNAGLWPPNKDQTWGPLKWQPIAYSYEPLDEDTLLLVRKPCLGWNEELDRVFNTTEIQEKWSKYKDLLKYIEENTGKKMRNFDDFLDVYATLQAEDRFGFTLPPWTVGYFPQKMEEPTAFQFKLSNYNSKLIKLKGGLLLKKLIKDWTDKRDGKISPKNRKAFLYAGHDCTISNILSALKVFDTQVLGYGVAILLELSKDKATNEYGVEVFFRNSTTKPPIQLQIPGCDLFCPLTKLIDLTKENIPDDWVKQCVPNDPSYIPPAQGGL